MNLVRYPLRIDVAPAIAELDRHPELWNRHPERTGTGSPHEGVDDIWLRFRDKAELTEPQKWRELFSPVFYPEWRALPALRPIVMGLMRELEAVQLGGILITRIPAGGAVKPHHDRGTWHAEFFETKLYVPLRANGDCLNFCEGEDRAVAMAEGEVWSFDNQRVHSVENDGASERITLIVCLRCES